MGLDTTIYLSAIPKCPGYDLKVYCYMTPDLVLVQNVKSYRLLVSAIVLSWLACKCIPYVNAFHPFMHNIRYAYSHLGCYVADCSLRPKLTSKVRICKGSSFTTWIQSSRVHSFAEPRKVPGL